MATQLTQAKRYQIAAFLPVEKMQKKIAATVGVSPSTLSRELQRNGGRENYDPDRAQQRATGLRQAAQKRIKMTFKVIHWIESKIRLEWSPEQIANKMFSALGVTISHERIYQHIWQDKRRGGTLYKHLRQSGKKRKKQGSKDKGALVTIVDRKSLFTFIAKVDSKHADGVTAATIELLKPYKDKLFTITADNGKEFAGHEKIAQQLDLKVYFAHPYSSWERGANENTNGLIRQYFPKGSSFEEITEDEVKKVMHRLNHRPRKTLNYKTPFEVFFENSQRKAA